MIPRVGQKIGPYEILGRLGSGGMGLVFSAWDGRLHRDVAIKLLKDEFLNPTMRSRFLGEARAASRLNHPNICTIFDIGEEQDCPYMVMELLKGDTLRGRMQQGPMPVSTIIQVATQVAEALSLAHEHGIVHRDVKPANVVLVDKPNGAFQTKVLDFGLAKVDMEGLDSHSGLTTTGMTVGTVSYMSPEQARGELLDGRSDLFSLGVLMYEMATRKLPFDGATSALVFVQLLNHPPESLRTLNVSVPRALEQVINTCLQKKRDDRYQNGHELVLALQRVAQNLESNDKQTSWLSKFAGGLKREINTQAANEPIPEEEQTSEPAASLQMSSDDAFLRPFRPQRKSGSDSKHFEPVNAPYSPSEGYAAQRDDVEAVTELTAQDVSDEPVPMSSRREIDQQPVESSRSAPALPGIAWLDEAAEAPPHDEVPLETAEPSSSKAWRILIGSLLAAAILVITVAVALSKKKAAITRHAQTVSVTGVVNHTGDSALGDVVAGSLELALQQSPWLGLRGSDVAGDSALSEIPPAGTPALADLQQKAKAVGAAAFVVGEIRMEGPTYALVLHVYDSGSGAALGECNSNAPSRERLPGAVDVLAANLRSVLGEPAATITAASLPLSRIATSNMDALIAFRQADQLEKQGNLSAAAAAFEHAASLDQQFAGVYTRLATLYSFQHASVSAANAANRAQAAANGDEGTKLLAAGQQALLGSGDLQKAALLFTQLTMTFPASGSGFVYLARTQRLQGDFPNALASAQQATKLGPLNKAALEQKELALLALDRTDEALSLKQSLGLGNAVTTSAELLSRFVHGEAVTPAMFASVTSDDLDQGMTEAALLDASGQFAAGLMKWRAVAQLASASPPLVSAGGFALSQAALNRAVAGDCTTAASLNREASAYTAGPDAGFALGLGSAICGHLDDARYRLADLVATYPSSSRVRHFYSSDLNAVLQWKSGALSDAVGTLQSAAQYDQASCNAYILGQVYLAQGQPQPATVALQASLRHPGALVEMNPEMLPMMYVSLARAFAANGDLANSARSYAQAAGILRNADAGSPILTEVRAGAGQ